MTSDPLRSIRATTLILAIAEMLSGAAMVFKAFDGWSVTGMLCGMILLMMGAFLGGLYVGEGMR